jgi:hypothetical protein
MFSNILLSRYVDETTGNHQCGFQHNPSTTDQMFCITQILKKKLDYNVTLYNSVKREVLYNIITDLEGELKCV